MTLEPARRGMVGAEGILDQSTLPRMHIKRVLIVSEPTRTIPRTDQEEHPKPRKPLFQLSFLAQKSTYGISPDRTAPGRGSTQIRIFFYFVFTQPGPSIFLMSILGRHAGPPRSLNSSPILYVSRVGHA